MDTLLIKLTRVLDQGITLPVAFPCLAFLFRSQKVSLSFSDLFGSCAIPAKTVW